MHQIMVDIVVELNFIISFKLSQKKKKRFEKCAYIRTQ